MAHVTESVSFDVCLTKYGSGVTPTLLLTTLCCTGQGWLGDEHVVFLLKNLLEKPSAAVSEQYATQMIHFKSVPVLNVLVRQTKDDTDLQEDIEFLHDKLNTSLQDLRSVTHSQGFAVRHKAACIVEFHMVQFYRLPESSPAHALPLSAAPLMGMLLKSRVAAWNGVQSIAQTSSG